MPGKSSNSVNVVFADKSQIFRQVREYADRVKRQRREVQKIGLFGSYANETYGPASDVDLLIILRESSRPFLGRIPEFMPENLDVCCDVLPYTEAEIKGMKQQQNLCIKHIFHEAVWL